MVNIIVVFRKIEDARNIRNILMRSGFSSTSVSSTGIQAIGQIDSLKNGIIICGYHLPDMLYSELHDNLPEDFEMLLMAKEDMLPVLRDNGIVCLSLPAKVRDLVDTVTMLQRNVEVRIKKRRQMPRRHTEEEEEIIRQAKGVLMNRNNMSEPEAHRYIQKSAMDTGTGFVETAQMVLDLFQ